MVRVADPLALPSWAARMADLAVQRLRDDPTQMGIPADDLAQRLRQATHVHAQNVADYIWMDSERDFWDPRQHVASARCPWESAWITFRQPPLSNESGRIRRVPEHIRPYTGILHQEMRVGDRYSACSTIFLAHRPERGSGAFWSILTELDEQGSVLARDEAGTVPVYWHVPTYQALVAQCPGIDPQDLNSIPMMMRLVALMTCAFANCRNVESVPRTYVPLHRKARRRGDYAGRRYYVLGIHPVTAARVDPATRKGSGDGPGVSHHICRGHFADYRHGPGLFGRYPGRFWIPQHARGRRSLGEVEKDYAIHAPPRAGGAA
jgi:hypothetical protein